MKNNKALVAVLLVFVLLLIGAYVLYDDLSQDMAPDQLQVQKPNQESPGTPGQPQQTEAPEQEKVPAPDFTVYDLEGNAVHLSDFIGKPVIVNFWASWCGPCQSEMPDFDEAYTELGEEIHFLMVNMTDGSRETVEKASSFITEKGYSFPVFYDTASSAAMTYGIYSLPTTLFIDAEGYGVAQATGAIDRDTLQRGIDLIT